MNKASEEILEKVKKLLALGASPSEAEAASALEKARVLLARYGLSMSDINSEKQELREEVILEKKRLRTWETFLINVICRCTFTNQLHIIDEYGGRLVVIGREINVTSALELFDYLHFVILKLGRTYSGSVAHLDSFKYGIVSRIRERLEILSHGKEEDGGHWGIDSGEKTEDSVYVPSEDDKQLTVQMKKITESENAEYINGKYGETKTTKKSARRVDSHSYNLGRKMGDGINLNRQIK